MPSISQLASSPVVAQASSNQEKVHVMRAKALRYWQERKVKLDAQWGRRLHRGDGLARARPCCLRRFTALPCHVQRVLGPDQNLLLLEARAPCGATASGACWLG